MLLIWLTIRNVKWSSLKYASKCFVILEVSYRFYLSTISYNNIFMWEWINVWKCKEFGNVYIICIASARSAEADIATVWISIHHWRYSMSSQVFFLYHITLRCLIIQKMVFIESSYNLKLCGKSRTIYSVISIKG